VPDLMRWFDLSRIGCFSSSKFEFFCLNQSINLMNDSFDQCPAPNIRIWAQGAVAGEGQL
jgi:hypothetical protein